MIVLPREDFKFEVTVDYEITFVFREVIPKDFYFFSLLQNDFPACSPLAFHLLMVARFLDEDESILFHIPATIVQVLAWWVERNILEEKIMKLEDWYNLAFHLQKQRWGADMEWLEDQPMSKILLMLDTQSKFNKEQELEAKKNRRK